MVKNIETNNEEVEAEGGSSNGMDEVTYENGFPGAVMQKYYYFVICYFCKINLATVELM